MILTREEAQSLAMSFQEKNAFHNYRVRMVYFKGLRCSDCKPGEFSTKSCDKHMMEMVGVK